MSYSTGGDDRVPEDDLEKSRDEVWPDKDLCFSSKISSQLANLLAFPCQFAAVCSSQYPKNKTPSQPQNRHGPLWAEVQVPHLLQGLFSSEFQNDDRG